ncbi:Protein CBG26012 [Caenorhabditis briggsae]|uniref:Protein CBG26012 n=1 Tax=Caenorhabditis briggsae TaxID=6238 RepID=B6IGI5_CAEBR|nr:Protein CBG26012 [Caenorhabditis briggsae]CAR99015.1 Protein CBG26012 [Caenorhabditis briggsae]
MCLEEECNVSFFAFTCKYKYR